MTSDVTTCIPMQDIIDRHWAWLQSMGYDQATPLEALALVTSEIGEAVNECRNGPPTREFGHELADIVLRVMGIAKQHNVDLVEEIVQKIATNDRRGRNKDRII